MANNKVKFLRGTASDYANAVKDKDTFYFTTDDGKLYIGDKEITCSESITIDSELSDTSENSPQTKIVKKALDNKMDKSGGTMTGALVAQSNTDYTTAQVRNVIISADEPSGTAPEGTIWYQYE